MTILTQPGVADVSTPHPKYRSADWAIVEFRDDRVLHDLLPLLKQGEAIYLCAQGGEGDPKNRHRHWLQYGHKWQEGQYVTGTHRHSNQVQNQTVEAIWHPGINPKTQAPHATVKLLIQPGAYHVLSTVTGPFTLMVVGNDLLVDW